MVCLFFYSDIVLVNGRLNPLANGFHRPLAPVSISNKSPLAKIYKIIDTYENLHILKKKSSYVGLRNTKKKIFPLVHT